MSDVVIRVQNLSKRYRLGEIRTGRTLSEAIETAFRRRFLPNSLPPDLSRRAAAHGQELWALKDVSFEVKRGDVLGIIGRNGAGKSTMLKIMSRITEPTSGQVEIRGQIGSLLEVGTGFHPELTGRENVYLNGAILGMSRAEIDRQFDAIVDFSEVARFIDTPVKRYSSGMQTRLAFAVAAHLDAPILIVDEVLSVGDTAFQKKCLGKIDAMTKSGRTVVFVSHNMGAINELCNKAALMHHGRLLGFGSTSQMIDQYVQLLGQSSRGGEIAVDENAPFSFISVSAAKEGGAPSEMFDIADKVIITVTYRVRRRIDKLQVAAIFSRNMIETFYTIDTDGADEVGAADPGLYRAIYKIPGMFLKGGSYSVRLTAGTPEEKLQELDYSLPFEVEELSINTQQKGYRSGRPGLVISPGVWTTEKVGS